MSNPSQPAVPRWAISNAQDFKRAPLDVKAAARASHISPKRFADMVIGGERQVVVWNSRRVETFDAVLLDVADKYLR